MKLFASIKGKFNSIKSRMGKNEKGNQRCRLENVVEAHDEHEPLTSLFDDMGPITAHMLIKRRIDKYIYSVYGLDAIENNRRFYIARVHEKNVGIIKTLLIDRQNGMMRTLNCRPGGKALP